MVKAFLDAEAFTKSLEVVSDIPESILYEKSPEALKFERVLKAETMEDIEDITLEEIDYMIINLGSLLPSINFSKTFLEKLGSVVMGKSIPVFKTSRRVL